ncbi:MAG TPA: hypothetical protein VE953_13995 [Terriglobales bacterium]|nr:hypothetical protein [Terriglobales bacterium]
MSTVLSALVILAALTASGVLLVQLAVSESRRGRGSSEADRTPSPQTRLPPVRTEWTEPATLPERAVPPPVPVVRRAPAARPAPVQPVVWAPTLSPDGAWLWTGSAWVPAWWGGPTVPPPPAYSAAVRPVRPARSHGCASALGMGCAVMLGTLGLIALGVLAATSGLLRLPAG